MPEVTLDILQTIGRDAGELSSKAFIEQLRNVPRNVDAINVDINSEGGSVFEGNAIAEALKQHPAKITTRCIGSALSIASVVFLAGDERLIAENGWVMIHEPMAESWGTASEIRQQAELIDGIREKMVIDYASRTAVSPSQAENMMREETWLDSSDAIKYGFATGVTGRAVAVALGKQTKYKNMPTRLIASNAGVPGGDNSILEDVEMSESFGQTIAAIRVRCRGASDQFILRQLELGTGIDEVTAAHNDAQASEIAELKQALAIAEARLAEYEEEEEEEEEEKTTPATTTSEDAPVEEEEEDEEVEEVVMQEEEEEEEEEETTTAKAKGSLRPVATKTRRRSRSLTYRAKWNKAIEDYMANTGAARDRAIKMINRNHPGLRERVVNESQLNQQRSVAV